MLATYMMRKCQSTNRSTQMTRKKRLLREQGRTSSRGRARWSRRAVTKRMRRRERSKLLTLVIRSIINTKTNTSTSSRIGLRSSGLTRGTGTRMLSLSHSIQLAYPLISSSSNLSSHSSTRGCHP
jgi:hypothetical protein